jgi:hypothetical protein
MAAPIALREDFDALALRGLAKKTREANQSRRLLALAEIYDAGSRGRAARVGGVGLQTIRSSLCNGFWIKARTSNYAQETSMSYRSLTVIAACVGCIFVSSEAIALGVMTDECLKAGKCACVSPKGRVSCCACPTPALAAQAMFRTPWTVSGPKCLWRRGVFGAWRLSCP